MSQTHPHSNPPQMPFALERDEGRHHHFLNHLATTKVVAGPEGSMSVVEFVADRGFGPPLHRHHDEDELMIILEGEVSFSAAGTDLIGHEGATVFLPHGIPHTFQVLSETARISTITASAHGTPRFDQLITEIGVPLGDIRLPAPTEVDPARVAAACASVGIEVLGPPPPPLPS